jgi:hypothetical protein
MEKKSEKGGVCVLQMTQNHLGQYSKGRTKEVESCTWGCFGLGQAEKNHRVEITACNCWIKDTKR